MIFPRTIINQPDPDEMDDPMFDTIAEHWVGIVAGYKQFGDKRPVVLYDIQEERVYLYPYEDFKNDMSPKSQASLTEQYGLMEYNTLPMPSAS